MNNQVLSFSLLAAGLGMGVVFLFLGILSVLMTAIKRLFGEGEAATKPAVVGGKESTAGTQSAAGGKRAGAGPAGSERTEGANGADRGGLPDWVMAAAVAYVMEEQHEFRRSAIAWQPEPGRGRDAWALPGKRR